MNTNAEATANDKTAAVAERGAQGMPDKAAPKKDASKKKSAPKGQKPAKRKAKAAATKKAAPPAKKAAKATASKESTTMRPESKGAKVLALISRPDGATLAEIMKVTNWQAHSVRGFISGNLGKKQGLKVASVKNDSGERSYTLAR
jgi:hypothetical protein